MRSVFAIFFSGLLFHGLYAQSPDLDYIKSIEKIDDLSATASVGTMGLSLEASLPVNDWVNVRAGVSFMPKLSTSMAFGVQVGEEEEKKYDENGNRVETKFDKMAAYLKDITGYDVDDRVDMDCKVRFVNAKVLVDFFPLATNKDWHLTAGFFWGSKTIGRACNSIKDMTTTLGVGIYNTMYDKIENFEPIFGNISLPPDVQDKIYEAGRMGMHVGDFKSDGKAYMMVPDKNGTVRAKAKVNSFKPYVGLGWNHSMKSAPEWRYGFEAGVIFWGGVPNVTTHDGTSLTHDVKNLDGRVADVISFAKSFPVYPLLEFKITRKIF